MKELVEDFSVCVSDAEEVADKSNPTEYAKTLSQIKANGVFQKIVDEQGCNVKDSYSAQHGLEKQNCTADGQNCTANAQNGSGTVQQNCNCNAVEQKGADTQSCSDFAQGGNCNTAAENGICKRNICGAQRDIKDKNCDTAYTQDDTDLVVIGADTIVVSDGKILGKPKDEKQAEEMLQSLSGKTHKVVTGVTVKTKEKTITFAEESFVTFKKLVAHEIAEYIKTGSPFDKAGAYGIQDSGFVAEIKGSYKNVMGLPVERLAEILQIYGG